MDGEGIINKLRTLSFGHRVIWHRRSATIANNNRVKRDRSSRMYAEAPTIKTHIRAFFVSFFLSFCLEAIPEKTVPGKNESFLDVRLVG